MLLWVRWDPLGTGSVLCTSYSFFQMRKRRLRMHGCDQAGPDVRPPQGMRLQPQEAGVLLERLWSHRAQG